MKQDIRVINALLLRCHAYEPRNVTNASLFSGKANIARKKKYPDQCQWFWQCKILILIHIINFENQTELSEINSLGLNRINAQTGL